MYTPNELQRIWSPWPEHPFSAAFVATAVIALTIKWLLSISSVQKILLEIPYLEQYSGSLIIASLFIVFISFLARNYLSKIEECLKFTYDGNGVLWHGNECNIALRDITFLKLLKDITAKIVDEKEKENLFLEAGRDMGRGFGRQFKRQIYPKELIKNNIPFSQLSKAERLRSWIKYDSSTGWGLISEMEIGKKLCITAKHPTLFDEETGGKCFSYIMAGYAESLVNEILSDIGMEYELSGNIETDDNETISFYLLLRHC